jgi:hypothetical protein
VSINTLYNKYYFLQHELKKHMRSFSQMELEALLVICACLYLVLRHTERVGHKTP